MEGQRGAKGSVPVCVSDDGDGVGEVEGGGERVKIVEVGEMGVLDVIV
jgi:hypothetical protein